MSSNTKASKKKKVGSYLPVQRRISVPAARHTSRAPELKAVDIPLSAAEVSTTVAILLLNGVQNGSSFYNRIGNKIEMKSLEFRSQIAVNSNAMVGSHEYLRFAIIYDAQPNGANPTWADIFTSYQENGTTTSTNWSFLNINNRERFKVFADWTFSAPWASDSPPSSQDNTAANNCQEAVNFHRFIKLKRLVTNYKGSSNPATIGDIATGSLLFVALGNRASGAANYNVNVSARLRYYDT